MAPWNPENSTSFPRAHQPADDYNQGEEKAAVSILL